MSYESDTQNDWGSRKIFLAAMLSQTLNVNTIVTMPQKALLYGAAGHIILFAFIYIFIGIPLLYMEYVTGQFTGRNCWEVWKARPFLSHFAYVQIFWQLLVIIFSHSYSAFVFHYFIISFDEPIPYYACGDWTNKDCNILFYNYTIHQDCLTMKNRLPYCSQLYKTFPEYQYWRYKLLRLNRAEFHLPWRLSLASAIICVFLFLSCFRRIQSLKWVLGFCTICIVCFRILFLIGSMLQKGIIAKFQEALDIDFTLFFNHVEFTTCVVHIIFSLNVGSGISFNVSSRSSFRSPCYSNIVIVVVITGAISILGVNSDALMLCPYCYKFGVHPAAVVKYNMLFIFEMIPRFLYVYESRSFWLILCFILIAMCFFSTNCIIICSFIDILGTKYTSVAKYPGLMTMLFVIILFIATLPLLGNKSIYLILALQRSLNFIIIFSVLVECLVFLIYYGFDRFSEDVHFMLGVQPKLFVKLSWIVSIIVLPYVFCIELYAIYIDRNSSVGKTISWWLLMFIMLLTILVTIIRILKAMYKKKLNEEIGLDQSWGPKSEVLKRSRAMFTTHAMTKEYIYRQYHLQAGILRRQKNCNMRS